MNMNRQRSLIARQDGFALVYMAAVMTVLLLFTGLAVDTGRAYVVRAQLSKAVDGAALGAARNLNGGDPRGEAARIFKANFPDGYLGTNTGLDPTAAPNFFNSTVDTVNGINVVTVTASETLPTTFMQIANFRTVTVTSEGEATRRMVDLSILLDVSSSIGAKWSAVRDAVRTFVGAFDQAHDRVALLTFGNGATVLDAMPSSRGFDKPKVIADVPSTLPGGSTNMVEGIYRAWDEVRSVPMGSQSGLRVIVLFTDGASNGVPGNYDASPGVAKTLRTWDFPKNLPDPDSQTWDSPHIDGLYDTQTGTQSPSYTLTVPWNSTQTLVAVPYLPLTSWHTHHRSPGIATSFPLQTPSLAVNGVPQDVIRGLRNKNIGTGRYPAEVFNTNNAARNLLEIIANEARNDNGDYRIRIYTIGMGELVRYMLGTMPEKPEDILMRISNDRRSPDFNSAQLEGKYYFAQTSADVGPAFQALQSQIVRLSK
jgi:Flp pilus assembly protein TadG